MSQGQESKISLRLRTSHREMTNPYKKAVEEPQCMVDTAAAVVVEKGVPAAGCCRCFTLLCSVFACPLCGFFIVLQSIIIQSSPFSSPGTSLSLVGLLSTNPRAGLQHQLVSCTTITVEDSLRAYRQPRRLFAYNPHQLESIRFLYKDLHGQHVQTLSFVRTRI